MSVLIKVVEQDDMVFAAAPCGCAHRMNVSAEQIGERVFSLIQHARDVAAGETGGCYTPSQINFH